MSLLNKSYKDVITGQTLKVNDISEGIVTLNNGDKVVEHRLMDNKYYEEVVDPLSFFDRQSSSLLGNITEKLKNIDTTNIVDEGLVNTSSISTDGFTPLTNESAIIEVDENYEIEQLSKKYNTQMATPKTISPEDLLGIKPTEPTKPVVNNVQNYTQPPVEDPILSMFKNVKRIVDFNIDLKVEGKIPRIDFIEMMEDSYNKSIIDYLVDEFTNDLLRNPESIKKMIKEKIVEMVNGNNKTIVKSKRVAKPKAKVVETPEIVVEPEVKTNKRSTRKPRLEK